jgi:zinc/manganese transport system ATP-binding protein
MKPEAAIVLRDLTVAYNRHPAVHHLNGRFAPGSLTAIVGPNGAGKSTLLKAIVGALRPAEGLVELNGLLRSEFAYLPQQAEIDRTFPITVADTILMGAWSRIGIGMGVNQAVAMRAGQALSAVGLDGGFGRRPIDALSAGQFQRVLFARILLQDARVVLLDEPFTAIDAKTTRDLLGLVVSWHKREERIVIAVLHDLDQVHAYFPQTLLLARELVAWGDTDKVLTPENLHSARRMAENWDEDAELCDRSSGAAA